MKELLIYLLDSTAWSMDKPGLFGSIHIIAFMLTAASAVLAAMLFSRLIASRTSARQSLQASRTSAGAGTGVEAGRHFAGTHSMQAIDHQAALVKVLSVTGWILILLEAYKQLFIYYVINSGVYDWWFFPFQLCSVPMYLCILLPFTHGSLRSTFLTFMSGYTFISSVAALIFPQDYLRSYITLTAHGFIWHGLLLFISLTIFMTGNALPAATGRGFANDLKAILRAAMLFAVLCAAAVIINAAAEPAMQSAYTAGLIPHDYAAMFYLNPFHISPQPLVSDVQKAFGIPAGLILYALTIAAASSITTLLAGRHGSFRIRSGSHSKSHPSEDI